MCELGEESGLESEYGRAPYPAESLTISIFSTTTLALRTSPGPALLLEKKTEWHEAGKREGRRERDSLARE